VLHVPVLAVFWVSLLSTSSTCRPTGMPVSVRERGRPARRVPVHRSGLAAVQRAVGEAVRHLVPQPAGQAVEQPGATVSEPRWILHLPTTLTSSEAAVDLAVALRQSLAHVSVLDLGELTLSEEDRQLLRLRVWCDAPLPDGTGRCALRDDHPGPCEATT
jgi:hypothetical protein